MAVIGSFSLRVHIRAGAGPRGFPQEGPHNPAAVEGGISAPRSIMATQAQACVDHGYAGAGLRSHGEP